MKYWQFKTRSIDCKALAACIIASTLLITGCTKKAYKNQADSQVYGVIQTVEDAIFGKTNEFNVNTKWSEMEPDEILSPVIVEGRTTTNQLELSLEDSLDLAASQSRTYQNRKEQLYLTALTLTGEQYQFGPKFFADNTTEFTHLPSALPAGGEFGASNDGLSIGSQVGVSQLLKTGGQLSVSLANDILRYYTGDPRNSTINVMSANFFQPLLRGFGKNNPNVERLTQAERNVIYAVRSYSFFQRDFAVEIVRDYFNLLGLKNIIRNNYANYISQRDSTKRLEARAIDREQPNQVNIARQSELGSRNLYVNSIATYFNTLDLFKNKLAIPLGTRIFLDDGELEKLTNTGLIPVEIDRAKAFELATKINLEILNSIDSFEDSKRKVAVAADQLRADLNIFADARIISDSPYDYTDFNIDDVRYNFGIELNLPIDRLLERNNYRSTLVSFEAELRNLELQLDLLKEAINRGLRTLEQRRQNFIIETEGIKIAKNRVQNNSLLLEAGRTTVQVLVDSQNAEIDAQNAVVAALVSYQNARLDLMLEIGVIETTSDNFWFASHLDNNPEIVVSNYQSFEMPRETIATPEEIFSN